MLLLAFLLLFVVKTSSAADVYYVKGSDEKYTDSYSPCETLQHYASEQDIYFTSDTIFKFLAGIHHLNETIYIHNATNITFMSFNASVAIITCNRSDGGLIFEGASNISLANLSFTQCGQPLSESLQRNGEKAHATLAFGEVADVKLESVSVTESRGYGLLGHCVHGRFSIMYSTFSCNYGTSQHLGGNAAFEFTNCSGLLHPVGSSLHVSYSNFTNGYYRNYSYSFYSGTLATGISMILSQSNTTVVLKHSNIEGNVNRKTYKGFGGNLFVHFMNDSFPISNNSVTIEDCSINNGTAMYGAGIILSASTRLSKSLKSCENSLFIQNSIISHNRGVLGSGLMAYNYVYGHRCPYLNVTVISCIFESNAVVLPENNATSDYVGNGVAVNMVTQYPNGNIQTISIKVLFKNCTFKTSYFLQSNSSLRTVGVTFAVANQENIQLQDCQFLSNSLTAIGAYRAKIRLRGYLTIHNNTGINGAGLMLCVDSNVYLTTNTSVSLIGNHAMQSGGAIYAESECFHFMQPYCFFQFNQSGKCAKLSQNVQIELINNTADYAGDHIYGGSVDKCYISGCESSSVFRELFKIDTDPKVSPSAVTSDPMGICFCTERIPNCEIKTLHYRDSKVYPGSNISIYAVLVGQLNGTVPGTILTSVSNTYKRVYPTEKFCTLLNIPLFSDQVGNITIHLDLQLNNITYLSDSRKASVLIESCPAGFVHYQDTCVCDPKLQKHNVLCNISNQQIERFPPSWIGYIDEIDVKGVIYHQVCPYHYCHDRKVWIMTNGNVFDQDSQCAPDRVGLLCSTCRDGLGLSIGGSDCLKCEAKAAIPLFILGFFLLGIMLVVFLVVFNATYTEGKLSGLLFYANIVYLNSYIFFPPKRHILHFVISWLNLNFGVSFCLYEGMGINTKLWLNFCFPTYLFTISGIIVVLCRKSRIMSRMFGGNIIKVLATLFQLSYTSLMQTVVVALSFTQIQYPATTHDEREAYKLVWLADPSVQYFHGKHLPLALIAILFGIFILAYTLVLLFVQPLQRYSHVHCFSWVAKLKPLIDAYTAPHVIQDSCRYWEGLLLLFRLILSIILTASIGDREDINLTAISTVSLILLAVAWSVNGIYKRGYLNILNSISILNLAVLSTLSFQNANQNAKYETLLYSISTNTSFGVAFLIILLVISYSIVVKMKQWYFMLRRKKYEALDVSESFLHQLLRDTAQ